MTTYAKLQLTAVALGLSPFVIAFLLNIIFGIEVPNWIADAVMIMLALGAFAIVVIWLLQLWEVFG